MKWGKIQCHLLIAIHKQTLNIIYYLAGWSFFRMIIVSTLALIIIISFFVFNPLKIPIGSPHFFTVFLKYIENELII